MSLLRLDSLQDRQSYQEYLKNAPGRSLWQSLQWKGYQEALGRETRLYGFKKVPGTLEKVPGTFLATAIVIIDRTRGGLSVWDIPRGPIGEPEAAVELLGEIVEDAKKEGALAVYFSKTSEVSGVRFQVSGRKEQPEATVVLDLTLSDDELLMQMHEKCRYNIRLAEKRGVVVKESRDVAAFYGILQETASRDGFIVKSRSHYEKFLTDLPGSFLLFASEPMHQLPVAGLLGVTWGDRGYYYYGASLYAARSLMAPSLLQWEAMRLCRERGCTEYDLLGIERQAISDKRQATNVETVYRLPLVSSHAWAGITRFKLQFGGRIEEYPPEQVIILRPLLFRALSWKRKIVG